MEVETAVECPRPEKKQLTKEEAEQRERSARHYLNPDIRAYECVCGHWHLGKSKAAFNRRLKGTINAGNNKARTESRRRDRRRKR